MWSPIGTCTLPQIEACAPSSVKISESGNNSSLFFNRAIYATKIHAKTVATDHDTKWD